MKALFLFSLFASVACFTAVAPGDLEALKKDLQAIVDGNSEYFNCSYSVAIKSPGISDSALTFVAGEGAATVDDDWLLTLTHPRTLNALLFSTSNLSLLCRGDC